MKKAAVAVLSLITLASLASASIKAGRPNHASSLSGTVASVDEAGKMLTVKNKAGKETTLAWTDATKVTGGSLKAGERVSIRWIEKDGKSVATSIQIAPVKTAASHKKSL